MQSDFSFLTDEIIDSTTQDELKIELARVYHLEFINYCWQLPDPFKIGIHTEKICEIIDTTIDKLRQGVSSYVLGMVTFGHGKSSIVSSYLPSHFIGEFPDKDILVSSYSAEKTADFSIFGRKLMQSKQYREVYPHIKLAKDNQNISHWGIDGHFGNIYFTGIDGSITGRRPSLIVLDDYIKGRAEAESVTIREGLWNNFKDNIMSRRASTCIVFILCTPWHKDDIAGRIEAEMKADKDYPQFEIIKFPAESKVYPTGYLFPELYSLQWYQDQKKLLGSYGTASLMQCEPVSKVGNRIRTDKINFYDTLDELPYKDLQFKRAWDLASSTKALTKSDPDYTVGIRGAVNFVSSSIAGINIPIMIIDDMIRGQWEATQRQQIIRDTAIADGEIECGIEAFAAYKDAYTTLEEMLKGLRIITKMQLPGDKIVKAQPLEPIFEAGNIWIKRASWNQDLINEVGEFPSGHHDDIVDAIAVLYGMFKSNIIQLF